MMLQALAVFIIACIAAVMLALSYLTLSGLYYVWDRWVTPFIWKVWIWFYLSQYPS